MQARNRDNESNITSLASHNNVAAKQHAPVVDSGACHEKMVK